MTTHPPTVTLSKVAICLYSLSFLPNALAYTQCVNGVCTSYNNKAALSTVAIAGIVIGIVLLLSIVGIIFAIVRYRRIRRFQRTYVQNAQANAAEMNMVAPMYPSPAYPSHHTHHAHHDQALQHHNLAVQQANMQNNQFASSGFGGTSGTTGMTV
ncbi:hypothetical protein DFH08DRAFT_849594 [Mycena albidolilacea]|uniref:Uncharacterized protein n=1 Tax=Mycena albidolilacea TaxID=1033008 RepID=A0AAD7AEE1_9AGAR|nr:hypothetical protein DFH08DRAFT_849594 [Mycena albidolilacea]